MVKRGDMTWQRSTRWKEQDAKDKEDRRTKRRREDNLA